MNKKHFFKVVANLLFIGGAFVLSSCCGKCCKNEACPNEGAAVTTASAVDSSAIVLDAISKRTSIRTYQETAVEEEKVEKILCAGMAAPSAMNRQPWSFTVVNDKALLKQIADSAPNAGMAANAPLAIVVCGDMDKAIEGDGREFWVQDASAATENILLAAHALGLGAVWTGAYPNVAKAKMFARILNIPDNQVVLCVIPMGYPAEAPAPKDKWNEGNVHYNVWK